MFTYNISVAYTVGLIFGRVSKQESDCCLTPSEQFFSYFMWEKVTFWWNDDDSTLYRTNTIL